MHEAITVTRPARQYLGRSCGLLLLLTVALLIGGCSDSRDWALKELTGLMPSLAFELQNTAGETVHADAFEGQVVALFFGFTNCPHICPMTLAKLNYAMDRMDEGAEDIRVLFVTVDPERDSPQALEEFVSRFGDQFVGLRGNDDQLIRVTKRYRTTYSRGEPDANGDYPVTHSSAVYIFDRDGQVRLMAREDDSVDEIAADLEQLAALHRE